MFFDAASQPTVLRYDLTTTPLPLQASPATGSLAIAQLTITATNPNSHPNSNPVNLAGLIITLPVGDDADSLTHDASSIGPVPPSGWNPPIINYPSGQVTYTFQPSAGQASVGGDGLSFVFDNIQINRQTGTVLVQVTEGSNGCSPPNCPTAQMYVTKFPNGWGQVSFWANPANINEGGNVTLNWEGPQGATYSIQYYTPTQGIMNVPAAGQPALASQGSYPGQEDPPLVLDQSVVFTLNVDEAIDSQPYHAQVQQTVIVARPAPTITTFSGKIAMVNGVRMLTFQWATENADHCILSTDPSVEQTPASPANGYQIKLSPPQPTYTLTAVNESGQNSATLNLTWVLAGTYMTGVPNAPQMDMAISSDGSRLYLGDGTVIQSLEPTTDDNNPLTPAAGEINLPDYLNWAYVISVAVSHDGTMLYSAYYLDRQQNFQVYTVSTLQPFGSAVPTPHMDIDLAAKIVLSPDSSLLYTLFQGGNSIVVFNVTFDPSNPLNAAGSLNLSTSPVSAAMSPDGSHLYVVDGSALVQGLLPTGGGSTANSLKPDTQYTLQLASGEGATGIGIAPGISYPAAVCTNANNVYVVNTNGMQVVGSPVKLWATPASVAVAPDGCCIYVSIIEDGSVSAIIPAIAGAS